MKKEVRIKEPVRIRTKRLSNGCESIYFVADLERAGKRHAVITGVVEGGDPGVQAGSFLFC